MYTDFDPLIAFSRNLGWLTLEEQKNLMKTRVGIVGMGGVGGQYAEILTRLGVGHFVIYDGDRFSIENSNRQNECKTSTCGKPKAEVIRDLIKDINPHAQVECHSEFLKEENIQAFCEKIDVYIDGIDFFEFNLRTLLFRKMRELKKPAITVAPVAAGSATVVFTKDSMSFDDYFGLHTTDNLIEKSILFLQGLTPFFPQASYLVDRSYTRFHEKKVPSLPIGVYAAAAAASSAFLKIVLNRGPLKVAPWTIHYDYYTLKYKTKYIWMGHRNPIQRVMHGFLLKRFS